MNIYDISQKAGVSIATVSRVLNHNKNVSDKTRQKVLAVMKQEDYQPNAFARGLTLNTMQTIGLLCADSSDSFLGSAVYYLEQGLRSHGYDTLLSCTGYDPKQKEKCLDILLSKHVDALILVGSNFIEKTSEKNAYLYRAASQVPLLILNGYLKGDNIYSCLCDDTEAVAQATKRLLQAGYQTPLFLYRTASFSGCRKKEGFELAHEAVGLSCRKEQLLLFNGSVKETCDMLLELYENHPFQAVIAGDDELAVGALKFAKAAGLHIPKDFAVIGYNDSKLAVCCEPELTSIDNRLEYLCSASVSLLMNLMEKKAVPDKTMVSTQLILRDTTPDNF